ncbi:MAG: ABC transporter permease, partial [archaeon]|nr:ABC transporter permease [archaeon]
PLEITQDLMDAEDNISSIYVKLDNPSDVETVEGKIDSLYGENLTTISSLSDLEMVRDLIDMLDGASWAISLLAIIIGGVGIINTMLTSVLERTRELGVLKAVGWSDRKILIRIIGESIVITLVAGVVGSICGIIGVELLSATGTIALTPTYTINTFVKAFGIALIVGVIGGLYPAIKATRLPPTEALRYE